MVGYMLRQSIPVCYGMMNLKPKRSMKKIGRKFPILCGTVLIGIATRQPVRIW